MLSCPKGCGKKMDSHAKGPMARHAKACGGQKGWHGGEDAVNKTVFAPKVVKDYIKDDDGKPSIDYVERIRRLEENLAALGKHIPETPSPFLIKGKGVKVYLTQLKINLDSAAKLVSKLLDCVHEDEKQQAIEEVQSKTVPTDEVRHRRLPK
jgi:hypothetical protein